MRPLKVFRSFFFSLNLAKKLRILIEFGIKSIYLLSFTYRGLHCVVPRSAAGRVGFVVPVEGATDRFIVGLERSFCIVQWDGGDGSPASVVRELGSVDRDVQPPSRINDGKADPRGRIFAGNADLR